MGRNKLAIDESRILELRSEGKTIKEISDDLKVSTATLILRVYKTVCNLHSQKVQILYILEQHEQAKKT